MSTSKFVKSLFIACGLKNIILNNINLLENSITFICNLAKPLKKCSKCGSYHVHIKDTKIRRLRMVPWGKMKCFLEIKVHKYKCKNCGSSSWVSLPFAIGKLPMTEAFVIYVLSLVKISTIKAVALFVDLQWKTVCNIHKDYLKKKYKNISYKNLEYLSVDEISIKKGHIYMSIFTDITTGRIIYAVKGRTSEDIKPFLLKLSKRSKKLKAIAMDMSNSYISAVKENLPHIAIIFDKFHVVKKLNEAVDDVRREERKANLDGDIGKGDRFLVLKNFENLDQEESSRLKKLLEINNSLAIAHTMKEQFRMFWKKETKEKAAKFLVHWILESVNSKIQPLVKVAKTILDHYEGLLNYYNYALDNGKAEGINNKIKVAKRKGYGYRNLEYFTFLLYDLHNKSIDLV